MNTTTLIGRIANELELKYLPSGQHCTVEFNLAVNRPKQKDKEQEADFIRVVVWNKQAENLVKYQSKGSQIAVNGRIRVENYTDQQGNKRITTKVVASEVQFLDSKKNSQESTGFNSQTQTGNQYLTSNEPHFPQYQPPQFNSNIQIDDSDLPF